MPIHYITHSDPPRADGKRTSQHLRPTKLQSVDLMALVDEMHTEEPIFTRGTSTGVLYALASTLFDDRSIIYRSVIINGLNKMVYYVEDDTLHIAGFWDTRSEPKAQASQV